MIDTTEPLSPGWWLKTLARQLMDRNDGREGAGIWSRRGAKPSRVRPGLNLLGDHFCGDPPLMGCAQGWAPHFREVTRLGRLNVAALVVEAKANRMPLRDFRTAAANDELGDQEARKLMRANKLKLVAREVHEGMLSLGDSYVMVTPPDDRRLLPLITAEDAREVITAEDPATGETLAGLRVYRDEWNAADWAHLFLRAGDRVDHYVAVKPGASSMTSTAFRMSRSWEWRIEAESVPAGRMPIVRFKNRRGVGEFEHHLDTLDRINDQILDKMVIAKVQAFRQRAIKGLPETDELGREIDYSDAFEAAPGSMWQVPADVEFWESQLVDMNPIRQAIKDDLEHLAAVTSTPLHTITPDAASGSAEGASLMREEHVYAVENRRDYAEPSWAEVMSVAFAFMGDSKRADVAQIEPIWGPIERYSLTERSSAAAQLNTILPTEAIFTDVLQYPPAEVPNLRTLRGRDLLLQVAQQKAQQAQEPEQDNQQTQQGQQSQQQQRQQPEAS